MAQNGGFWVELRPTALRQHWLSVSPSGQVPRQLGSEPFRLKLSVDQANFLPVKWNGKPRIVSR